MDLHVYYAAYVLFIGFSFPVLNISIPTLFSYILGPRRQGTQQGIVQMSGGIARMLGPILIRLDYAHICLNLLGFVLSRFCNYYFDSSGLYAAYGPTMAWNMELLVCSLTLLLWLIFYNRMVPLEIGQQTTQKQMALPSKNENRNKTLKQTISCYSLHLSRCKKMSPLGTDGNKALVF